MWKSVEYERAYHAQYMKDSRRWLKEHHYCCDCQKQDAYTLNGRYRCAECAEKKNAAEAKRRAEIRSQISQKEKNLRKERAISGRCTKCGVALPDGYVFLTCKRCRRKDYIRHGYNTVLPKRVIYREEVLCVICGSERMTGETKNGKPIQLCKRCYDNIVNAGKKGRERYRELYGKSWGARRYEWEHAHRPRPYFFKKAQ